MGEYSPRGRSTSKEAQERVRDYIELEIKNRSGYGIKMFRSRIEENLYDALMVLRDIKHMASKEFFYNHFGICPRDFERKPVNNDDKNNDSNVQKES